MYQCRICGWTGDAETLTVREMMYHTREEFQYFECGNCHCLQIAEVPENLADYYGDSYYSYEPVADREKAADIQRDETRVLDVGCGAGEFLCCLADEEGLVNLTGCDPFIKKDIEYKNGVKIYKSDIHGMTGQFDWINLNDSFEHMTDPHEVMESMKRLLAPGGAVRMKLPVYPNIAFDMFGTNWYQIDAPRHIFLHTKQSLEYLAEKHGFIIARKTYDSRRAQILFSYFYLKDISFYEITSEIIEQHFTQSQLLEIDRLCKNANQNEYGDHAEFYFVHKNERG